MDGLARGGGRRPRSAGYRPVGRWASRRSASSWRWVGTRPAIRPGRLTCCRPIAGQDTI